MLVPAIYFVCLSVCQEDICSKTHELISKKLGGQIYLGARSPKLDFGVCTYLGLSGILLISLIYSM